MKYNILVFALLVLSSTSTISCNKDKDYSKYIITCLGDSITYGYTPKTGVQMKEPYPVVLQNLLGCQKVYNLGINGSTISNGDKSYCSMVDRLSTIDSNSNLIIVWGGGNDYARDCPIGEEGNKDPSSLYGGLYKIGELLTTTYSESKSMFITPLPIPEDCGYDDYHIVRDAVVYTANLFKIPVLDLFNVDTFKDDWDVCYTDYIHPSQLYVKYVMTPQIVEFIKKNI